MAKGDETRSNYVFAWGRQGNGAELKTRTANMQLVIKVGAEVQKH